MTFQLLSRVIAKFRAGLLRKTKEKLIDLVAATLAVAYRAFLVKFSTPSQDLAILVSVGCFVIEVQIIAAAFEVWREVRDQPATRMEESPIITPDSSRLVREVAVPKPKYLSLKLIGIPVLPLAPLGLICLFAVRLAIASERTYAYLAPTAELMECQKRAFFPKTAGPQVLHNVNIELRDDGSGKSASETYAELDPDLQLARKPLWFAPSSPWDEQYTVTVTARESQSSQRLVIRSSGQRLQLATQVTFEKAPEPIVECRDKPLPGSYKVAPGDQPSCGEMLALEGDMPDRLDVASYQTADGNLTVRRVKELPSPSVLDAASDDRHITEYQHQIIEPILKKYWGSRVRIYVVGAEKTKAYAEEFKRMFNSNGWVVRGPDPVPAGDERLIDLQLSVNYGENWNKSNPERQDLMDALKKAGVKHRTQPVDDRNVPRNWFVLWVGPRSPNAASPDQCSPAEMRPESGRPHTCETVKQTDGGYCPFVPK